MAVSRLWVALMLLSTVKVAILGGDGFCGWPASLYLSDHGHDVIIVDNLSRRAIDTELGAVLFAADCEAV